MAQKNTTGLRPETFKRLQLNAGILLKDFAYSSATDAAALATLIKTAKESGTALLGATRGGGTFACTPETREIEADGRRNPFVGSTIFDGWDIKLSTTLLEITPGNLAMALPGASVSDDTGGKVHTLTLTNDVDSDDYIDNLVWIGDTSEGYMLIDLENALNTSGVTMTYTDKGEGTLPVEFVAHAATLNDDTMPFKIVHFDKAS